MGVPIVVWLVAAGALLACGGPGGNEAPPAMPKAGAKPAPRDQTVTLPQPISVAGAVPAPAQLRWPAPPPMPASAPELGVLRKRVGRARPKAADVELFARALATRAHDLPDEPASHGTALELWREARASFEHASATVNDAAWSAEARALWSLAEAKTGDPARALERLGAVAPSEFVLGARAVIEVVAGRNEPSAAVAAAAIDEPVFRYARAWLHLRAGDAGAAYRDHRTALLGWGGPVSEELLLELGMLGAHARVTVDEVAGFAGQLGDRRAMALRAQLRAFRRIGEYARAVELLPHLVEAEPASSAKRLRHRSDLYYQLGEPAAAAQQLMAAMDAAAECRDAECQVAAADLRERALTMAKFFHTVFATAQDLRYFEPALELYGAAGGETGNGDDEVAQLRRDLERLKVGSDPNAGVHTAEVLGPFVEARSSAVRGCHAEALVRDSEVVGVLRVLWSIDHQGRITGGTTVPGSGEAGLARVARCVLAVSRGWRFPARTVPGETRLEVQFDLSVAAEDAEP